MDDRSNVSVRNLALKRLAQTTPAGVGRDSLGGPPKCGVRRKLPFLIFSNRDQLCPAITSLLNTP